MNNISVLRARQWCLAVVAALSACATTTAIEQTPVTSEQPPGKPAESLPTSVPAQRPSCDDKTPLSLDFASWIKATGAHSYDVERCSFDKLLVNPPVFIQTVRISPETRQGQMMGIRMEAIRAKSVYTVLGYQNGDVVESINGFPMTTPANALAAYTSLKQRGQTMEVVVLLRRKGTLLRLVYSLK